MSGQKKRIHAQVTTTCRSCGNAVHTNEGQLALGHGKYCSKMCHNAAISYREKILAAMPGTLAQLADRARCSLEAVYKGVKLMAIAGKCHVLKLVPAEESGGNAVGPWALVYAVGPGDDPHEPPGPRQALHYWYKKIILEAMPCGQCDMEAKTRLGKGTISRLLNDLHKARACHIARWRKPSKGPAVAIYKVGDKKDAACNLVYEDRNAMDKRSMERRRKKDPERINRLQREAKSRYRKRKFGDPMLNFLFGTPQERKAKAAQLNGGNNE